MDEKKKQGEEAKKKKVAEEVEKNNVSKRDEIEKEEGWRKRKWRRRGD